MTRAGQSGIFTPSFTDRRRAGTRHPRRPEGAEPDPAAHGLGRAARRRARPRLGANLCFTFGFPFGIALELLFERLRGDEVAPVGPTLFRHGLVFSIGHTLVPIGIAWIGWLLHAVHLLVR